MSVERAYPASVCSTTWTSGDNAMRMAMCTASFGFSWNASIQALTLPTNLEP